MLEEGVAVRPRVGREVQVAVAQVGLLLLQEPPIQVVVGEANMAHQVPAAQVVQVS
jgi:hypothetical protein